MPEAVLEILKLKLYWKMNVLASSGNIDIIALSGYGNFQTTSGNIDLDFLGDPIHYKMIFI